MGEFAISEIFLFALIGAIVSLDVCGLTAVKPHTYLGTRRDAFWWAQRNAFWHAVLLLAYGLGAVGFFDILIQGGLDWLIELLREVPISSGLRNLLIEIKMHFSVGFALFTIFVVWSIYKNKIVENPLDFADQAIDNNAEIDWQRRLIRSILTRKWVSPAFVARQMEAVAVAIDMLALAFLLKSLDTFNESPLRVLEVSAIIYLTVFAVVFSVSRILSRGFQSVLLSNEKNTQKARTINRMLLIIRLAEPLLIFYFVCELICFVVWGRMSSSALFFIASGILTFALVRSVGLGAVVKTTADMANSLADRIDDERRSN